MAVNVLDAIATMQGASDWSDKAIKEIDEHLKDARWMRNSVRNVETNPTFIFSIEGVATKGDKERIEMEYTKAEWGHVTVRNSGENGQSRSGMVTVGLSQFSQDHQQGQQ